MVEDLGGHHYKWVFVPKEKRPPFTDSSSFLEHPPKAMGGNLSEHARI